MAKGDFGGEPGFGNNKGGQMDKPSRNAPFPRYDEAEQGTHRGAARQGEPENGRFSQVDTMGQGRSTDRGSVVNKSTGKNNTQNIQPRPTGGNSTATKQVPYQERIKGCID